jgi:hypothetical protein
MDGWTDGWMDGRIEWMDEWMDGGMEWMDGWRDGGNQLERDASVNRKTNWLGWTRCN